MYVCMYVCMHACVLACLHACMHACMHACVHVCVCVCVCVCVFPRGGRPLVAQALLPPGRDVTGARLGLLGAKPTAHLAGRNSAPCRWRRRKSRPGRVTASEDAAAGGLASREWRRRGPAWSPRRGAHLSGRIGSTRFCAAQVVAVPGAWTGERTSSRASSAASPSAATTSRNSRSASASAAAWCAARTATR